MIIRTEFIQMGGQAAHLSRTDTNKKVIVLRDLWRLAPANLAEAIRTFAAIARTNPRTIRELIHCKISPSHALSDDELDQTLVAIELELGIPDTMPRIVVRHSKGDRPDHFHVIWPLVDPVTGRAIKSNENYLSDELVSRVLEIRFGEKITPGPRQAEVVEKLRHRGEHAIADALSGIAAVDAGGRVGGATRQQAAQLGVDLTRFMNGVDACWIGSAGDGQRFCAELAKTGLRIARGDKAVLVLDDLTGFHAPLARILRQVGKANGRPIKIKESDLEAAFAAAPDLKTAREAGFATALEKAEKRVDGELARLQVEAEIDGETDLADRLKLARMRVRDQRRAELAQTLKARRREIADTYRRRDRIRRARVNRAFRAAKWATAPAVKNLVFIAAAGAVALAGGGLGVALVAAGLSVGMLPSFERARMLAALAQKDKERQQF